MTNADRIRAMTDEEMVEVIVEWCPDPEVGKCECEYAPYKDLCKQCWLDWLKQEVQEVKE